MRCCTFDIVKMMKACVGVLLLLACTALSQAPAPEAVVGCVPGITRLTALPGVPCAPEKPCGVDEHTGWELYATCYYSGTAVQCVNGVLSTNVIEYSDPIYQSECMSALGVTAQALSLIQERLENATLVENIAAARMGK